MTISVYTLAVETFVSMLQSLGGVLEKGAVHARAKNLDPAGLVNARLAPDMYPLRLQIQNACGAASSSVARLMGEEAPPFENPEEDYDQLKARVANTIGYLKGLNATAFDGAEDRIIQIPLPTVPKMVEMNGIAFVKDWALPHFYFHVVTAYDILRNAGVEIGKRDYMSHVGRYIRDRTP